MRPNFPAYDALAEVAGRSKIIHERYTIQRWDITAEELQNLAVTRDRVFRDAAGIISKKYNLQTWVGINQITNLSLAEYLGLTEDPFVRNYGYPDLIMQAISLEVEEVTRKIDEKRREQEMKLRDVVQKPALDALNSSSMNSSMNKVFN